MHLPGDVYVKKAWTTSNDFNPRYDAKKRIYHYFINYSNQNLFCASIHGGFYELNVDRMREELPS